MQVPDFYTDVPPAPEGLIWWQYAPGVPPLPTVASVLGTAFSRYQWRYDPDYQSNSFQFTDLDKVQSRAAAVCTQVASVHLDEDCHGAVQATVCVLSLQASMANIPPRSGLVAIHMISAWVMTIFVLCVSFPASAWKPVHPAQPHLT